MWLRLRWRVDLMTRITLGPHYGQHGRGPLACASSPRRRGIEFYARTIELLQGTAVVGICLLDVGDYLFPTGHRQAEAGREREEPIAPPRSSRVSRYSILYRSIRERMFCSTDSRHTQANMLSEIWDSGASTRTPMTGQFQRALIGAERQREAGNTRAAWSYPGARVVPLLDPENILLGDDELRGVGREVQTGPAASADHEMADHAIGVRDRFAERVATRSGLKRCVQPRSVNQQAPGSNASGKHRMPRAAQPIPNAATSPRCTAGWRVRAGRVDRVTARMW